MKVLRKIRDLLFGSKFERDVKISIYEMKNKKDVSIFVKIKSCILDWFWDKYTDFIIVPYETVCRFFYWGWKLRYSYEFEAGHGLYYMIYLKTKGLIDYSRKYAHLRWNDDENGTQFRKLKIACTLAQRLYKDCYNTNVAKHEEKWGKDEIYFEKCEDNPMLSEMKHKRHINMTDDQIAEERKEWLRAHKADQQQQLNERKYLFELLNKHMEGWWD